VQKVRWCCDWPNDLARPTPNASCPPRGPRWRLPPHRAATQSQGVEIDQRLTRPRIRWRTAGNMGGSSQQHTCSASAAVAPVLLDTAERDERALQSRVDRRGHPHSIRITWGRTTPGSSETPS
jgi:hypothetical protein